MPQPMFRSPGSTPIMRIAPCSMAEPSGLAAGWNSLAAGSLQKHTLQKLDLLRQCSVRGYETCDLSHGMEDGRVVPATEPPANFGKRARRQDLGQIHGDLARTHHTRGSPRAQNIAAAYIEMARDQFLDVLDFDLFRIRSPHQIANGELGGFHRMRRAIQ